MPAYNDDLHIMDRCLFMNNYGKRTMPTPFHTCARAPCPCPRLPCIPLPPPSSLHPLAPAFPASPAFHFSEPHKARIALTPPHSAYCTHSLSHPCSSPDVRTPRHVCTYEGRGSRWNWNAPIWLGVNTITNTIQVNGKTTTLVGSCMWGLEIVESLRDSMEVTLRDIMATKA